MTSTIKKRSTKTEKPLKTTAKPSARTARAKTGIRKPKKGTKYSVSDGELELELEFDGGKWYVVTCPAIPDLLTQARTIAEAFHMAYDAKRTLEEFSASKSGQGQAR